MITIVQKPNKLNLSGNLPKFIFFSKEPISFELKQGKETLFAGNYTPGKDDKITIDVKDIVESDLNFIFKNVLEMYEQNGIVKDFTAYVNGELVSSFRVIKAGVSDFGQTAETFLQHHFLTWQVREKKVVYSSPEYLTYYAVQDCVAIIRAYFSSEDGTARSNEIEAFTMKAGHAYTMPLMYACVVGKFGERPIGYDVWVKDGDVRLSNVQRYLLDSIKSEQEEYVLFANSLGGLDSFRAYGDTEYTEKNTHNVATVDDQLVPYRIDTENIYEKNTGYLSQDEQLWLRDFFPSQQKWIFKEGVLHGITLVEDKVSSSSSQPVGSYSFSYRYTDDTIYLNIPIVRTARSLCAAPLNVKLPDMQKLILEPRLAEYPSEKLTDGTLFPVQEPFAESWKTANAGGLANYVIAKINEMTDGRLLDNRFKGYFNTEGELKAKYPTPLTGESAWVGTPFPGKVYYVKEGTWATSGDTPAVGDIDLASYYTKAEIDLQKGQTDEKLASLSNDNRALAANCIIFNYSVNSKRRDFDKAIKSLVKLNVYSDSPNYYTLQGLHINVGNKSDIVIYERNASGESTDKFTINLLNKNGVLQAEIDNKGVFISVLVNGTENINFGDVADTGIRVIKKSYSLSGEALKKEIDIIKENLGGLSDCFLLSNNITIDTKAKTVNIDPGFVVKFGQKPHINFKGQTLSFDDVPGYDYVALTMDEDGLFYIDAVIDKPRGKYLFAILGKGGRIYKANCKSVIVNGNVYTNWNTNANDNDALNEIHNLYEKRFVTFYDITSTKMPIIDGEKATFPKGLGIYIPGKGFRNLGSQKEIMFPEKERLILVTYNFDNDTFQAYNATLDQPYPLEQYVKKDEYIVLATLRDMCMIKCHTYKFKDLIYTERVPLGGLADNIYINAGDKPSIGVCIKKLEFRTEFKKITLQRWQDISVNTKDYLSFYVWNQDGTKTNFQLNNLNVSKKDGKVFTWNDAEDKYSAIIDFGSFNDGEKFGTETETTYFVKPPSFVIGGAQKPPVPKFPFKYETALSMDKATLTEMVETASNGSCTVLYDTNNYPSLMYRIPLMSIGQIDKRFGDINTPHPAFMVKGARKKYIYAGVFMNSLYKGVPVSWFGVETQMASIGTRETKEKCAAKGKGWHMETVWEHSLISLLSAKYHNTPKPRGNHNRGTSSEEGFEYECVQIVRAKAMLPGTTEVGNGDWWINGSQPESWSHNNSRWGVYDITGGYHEFCDLLICDHGKILICGENNYGSPDTEWIDTGVYFSAKSGNLVFDNKMNEEMTLHTRQFYTEIKCEPGYDTIPENIRKLLGLAIVCPRLTSSDPKALFDFNGQLGVRTNLKCVPIKGGALEYPFSGLGHNIMSYDENEGHNNMGSRLFYIDPW